MADKTPERCVIDIPLGSPPRIVAAERSLFDQACRLCGHVQSVSQIPCPEWMSDKFRAMLAAPAVVGTARNVNALASKVFGAPMHGSCVLCRRPAKDEDMYGMPRSSDRYMQAFDAETAREALAVLEQLRNG